MFNSRGRLRVLRRDHAWVLSFPREFGAEIEEQLLPATERALATDATLIVLDFASVEFTNSAGVGAIVDVLRRARERSVSISLAGVLGQPRLVLERIGFFDLFPSYDGVDDAVKAGAPP